MSSVQSKSLQLTDANINSYRGSTSGNVASPYQGTKMEFIHTGSDGNLTLNDAAKNILFPNNTTKPIKCDITYSLIVSAYNLVTGYLNINGTKVTNDATLQHRANLTNWQSDKTQSGITLSGGTSTSKSNTTIAIGVKSTNGGIVHGTITLYFTRYDFSAVAGTGVTSASVSSSTGYGGDSITFSCVIPTGYVFDGWYSGTTLVSSSQSYTHTVNGADLTLTAKAHQQVVAKSLSATYNGSQLQGFPISVTADTPISYNGISKGTVPLTGGAKTFKCADKIANGNIVIGNKTLSCANKLMRTNVIACIAKNLLNTNDFSLSNVSVADGIYTFQPNTTAMISQSLPTPVAGHKYYGRCYQKAPSGSTFLDGRFEYYYTDGANLIFATMSDTARDNQWHLHSKILSLPSIASPSGWVLRSFTVSGTAAAYRKEMMIVDLTDMFGAGNEPDKAWCDANL